MPRKGSTYARGYTGRHERERERWKPRVRAGQVNCWRCGRWLDPAQPWDLGHDDNDRTQYRGPEHVGCNRKAGARASNAQRGHQPRINRDW